MYRWRIWIAVAASATALPLFAEGGQPQKDAGLPAGTVQPAPVPAETLGFRDATNRMTVPVQVDGKGPYAFIVDTGAERSVVSHELATALGLDPGARARILDFTGASMVNTVKVPSLSAGSLSTAGMEAPSLAAANLGASGMLGIDALQGHRVVIDFDRKRMTLSKPKKHASGDVVIGAEARLGQLIVTKAWFDGQPISVVIDTGSWVSVGNKAMLALAKRKPRLLGPVEINSVTGRTLTADYVVVDNIRVGNVRFDNFALSFADAPPFEWFGLENKPALILGMSSLRKFRRVEIDFVNREIGFSLPRAPIDFNNVCRSFASCRSFR